MKQGSPRYANWRQDGFPRWLQDQLRVADLSAADLAREMGIEPSLISRWMQGKQLPSAKMANRIAEALKISVDEVLTEAGLRPPLPTDADPRRAELLRKLSTLELTRERYLTLNALLNMMSNVNSNEPVS